MDMIEVKARIKFKKIGSPQPEEIIKATARDLAFSFDKVSDNVLNYFHETSNELLEKYTPQEALTRALAIISGYT